METGRINPDEIANKIRCVEYLHHNGVLTFCIITMLSGFVVTGQSACTNKVKYSKSKGEQMAYRDAFHKLHLMEQYASKDTAYTTNLQEQAA